MEGPEFYRIRLLQTSIEGQSFGAVKELPRYLQLPGTLPGVYCPKTQDIDWHAVAKDTTQPIILVEGEKKALAVQDKLGAPCLGLGGVDAIAARHKGLYALPEFNKIDWTRREAYVVFDTEPQGGLKDTVAKSAKRLLDTLLRLGAAPKLCVLPPDPAGISKTGADDFLLRHEPEDLTHLLSTQSVMTDAAKKLIDMACRYVFIEDMSHIFDKVESKIFRPIDFLISTNNTPLDVPIRKIVSANGIRTPSWVMDVIPAGKAFLDWPARPACHSIAYLPGKAQIVPRVDVTGQQRGHHINTWKGWACGDPVEGDISPFLWVLDNVFGDDPVAREFVEHWFFYPIQNPGAKLYTVMLVTSRLEGIGKTFPADMLAHHVYGLLKPYANANIIGGDGLNGTYNSYLVNRQFILVDDLAGSDVYQHLAQLKSLITNQTLVCKEKYVPEYTVDNLANFYMTSNELAPFKLTDQDRRFMIHEPRQAVADFERYKNVRLWFEREQGGAKLLWYAQNKYNSTGFDPQERAPMTRSKQGLIISAQTDAEAWLDALRGRCHLLSRPFVTPAELLALFQLEAQNAGNLHSHAFGRIASRYGWRRWKDGGQIKMRDGRIERAWIIASEDLVEELSKWDASRIATVLARDLEWKKEEDLQVRAEPVQIDEKKVTKATRR